MTVFFLQHTLTRREKQGGRELTTVACGDSTWERPHTRRQSLVNVVTFVTRNRRRIRSAGCSRPSQSPGSNNGRLRLLKRGFASDGYAQMTLDVRTFWLIGALVTTSCGLLVLILRKQYADHLGKSLVVFGTANVLLGLNYVLRLQRARVGDFFFYAVAGMLVTLCLSLEYLAVCLLKQQSAWRAWIYGPPAVVFAACCWFTFAERNISIALIICNVANMVLMIL